MPGGRAALLKLLGAAMQSISAPRCYVMADVKDSDFLLRGAKGGGLSGVSRCSSACRCASSCSSLVAARLESCCSSLLARAVSCWSAWRSTSGSFSFVDLRLPPLRFGLRVASAFAKWTAVSPSSVPACPIGMQTRLTEPQCFRSSSISGWYFRVFSSSLVLRLRSAEKPISIRRREHEDLSKDVGSGDEELGTPLA